MNTTQAFFLGMMAAWTPCLLILAWLLRPGAVEESLDD
jgi:hypothetical protein